MLTNYHVIFHSFPQFCIHMKMGTLQRFILLSIPIISATLPLWSQLDTGKVVIIVPTTASLSDGRKLEIIPQISRNTEIPKRNFTFYTLDKFSQTDKKVQILPPLSHVPDKMDILPNGYMNMGGGNYYAFLGNAYLANNSSDDKSAYGFNAHHFSTGVPKSLKNFSRNELGFFGKLYRGHEEFGLSFDFERNAYRYFSLPDSIEENINDHSIFIRPLTHYQMNMYYKNGDLQHVGVKPYIKINADAGRFSALNDLNPFGQFENNVSLNGVIRFEHNALINSGSQDVSTLNIEFRGDIDQITPPNIAVLNRYFGWIGFSEMVGINLLGKDVKLNIGAKMAIYADTLDPEYFFIPDIHAEIPVIPKKVFLQLGLDGDYEKQHYSKIMNSNPFVQDFPQLENTYTAIRGYTGLNANIAPGTSLLFRFSSANVINMPLFVGSEDPYRRFDVLYENLVHTTIKGQLNFNLGDKVWANLLASYHHFSLESEDKAWMMPDFDAKLRLHYITYKNKIVGRLDVLALGNRFARDENQAIISLAPLVDFNIGADYQFNKYLFFFSQFNNIAGTTYQRWYQFPVFGFNAQAGVGAKF
jgi:hypothetical protein